MNILFHGTFQYKRARSCSLPPAPSHPAHQSHTAAMNTRKATVDLCALNYRRSSFSQLLFLLSYILLESSLPARNGDTRQIHDICSRKENEWQPHIGEELYPEMKHTQWDRASPVFASSFGGWSKFRRKVSVLFAAHALVLIHLVCCLSLRKDTLCYCASASP